MNSVRRIAAVLPVILASTLTGCSYEGLNSLTLPGVKGTGEGAYTVKIQFPNAQLLVPNSPVRVGDLNVGSVRSVTLDGYQPVVSVRLERKVNLPENAVAKIGQTSLLGAKHVELAAPTTDEPIGRLGDGDTIGIERASTYPSTEEVLAATSALLNGGGLAQIRTITTEVNKILVGREGTVRSLLRETETFARGLDAQKQSIVDAITSMDRLAARFRAGNKTVADALEALPPALRILNQERERLLAALESLGRFGDLTRDFLNKGGGRDLVRNIDALQPTLEGLADAGRSLTDSLWVVPSVVFPIQTLDQYVRGDFYNLTITLDLRSAFLSKGLLEGTPIDSLIGTANGLLGQRAGQSTSAGNPLTDPLTNTSGSGEARSGTPEPTPAPSDGDQQDADILGNLLGSGS